MSFVDLVLIVLALLFALSGFRQGLIVSATSFVGFLGGAVLGAQLSGPVADRIDGSSVTRVFAALVVVLAGALLGQIAGRGGRPGAALAGHLGAGEDGRRRRRGGASPRPRCCWWPGWSPPRWPARRSRRWPARCGSRRWCRRSTRRCPTACARSTTRCATAIDRRGLPDVLDPLTPTQVRDVPAPDPSLLNSPVVAAVKGSVVQISGIAPSCSRQIDGSGFVFAPQRVMTNAHVLAGVADPVVHAEGEAYDATPVYVDQETDIAVLAVPGPARRCRCPSRRRRPTPAPTRSSWATPAAAAFYVGAGAGARPRRDQRAGLPQHRRPCVRDVYALYGHRAGRQLRRPAVRDRRQRARRRLRLGHRRPEHRLRADRAAGGRRRDGRARTRAPRSTPAPANRGPRRAPPSSSSGSLQRGRSVRRPARRSPRLTSSGGLLLREVADAGQLAPLVGAGDVAARAAGGAGQHAGVERAVQLQGGRRDRGGHPAGVAQAVGPQLRAGRPSGGTPSPRRRPAGSATPTR